MKLVNEKEQIYVIDLIERILFCIGYRFKSLIIFCLYLCIVDVNHFIIYAL